MIKRYENGITFYNENKAFLSNNHHFATFFKFDAPLLLATNKNEYAIKVYDDNHTLLVLSKVPYNLLFYGDYQLANELVDYLIKHQYQIKDYLCPTILGEELSRVFKNKGFDFKPSISMDFMEAYDKTPIFSNLIEVAKDEDLDEIYDLCCQFMKDCGIKDVVNKTHLKEEISSFRILRKNNQIISMARIGKWTDGYMKISYVFTKSKYRGLGYAKEVVGTVLNEIIVKGFKAVLNVDQNNPISNHVYASLGFKKIYSQTIFHLQQ